MNVVLIAAQKGGAGKSTLAAHFGALAEREGRTLLIDADPQGSLAFWYERRAAETPVLAKVDAHDVAGTLDAARSDGIAWTVIDSPPHNAPLIASLMSRATVTVIPVRPGPFDLAAVGATLDMARTLKAPIACVLNACPPPTRSSAETNIVAEARALLSGMGAPVLPGQVSQRASLSHALISGQAVNEFEPDGRAAQEIATMWAAVVHLARTFPPRA